MDDIVNNCINGNWTDAAKLFITIVKERQGPHKDKVAVMVAAAHLALDLAEKMSVKDVRILLTCVERMW